MTGLTERILLHILGPRPKPPRVIAADLSDIGVAHLDWCLVCDPDDERQAWIHAVSGLSVEG